MKKKFPKIIHLSSSFSIIVLMAIIIIGCGLYVLKQNKANVQKIISNELSTTKLDKDTDSNIGAVTKDQASSQGSTSSDGKSLPNDQTSKTRVNSSSIQSQGETQINTGPVLGEPIRITPSSVWFNNGPFHNFYEPIEISMRFLDLYEVVAIESTGDGFFTNIRIDNNANAIYFNWKKVNLTVGEYNVGVKVVTRINGEVTIYQPIVVANHL